MTLSYANLERRVERNTNDIEAIYDILTDLREKLTEHDQRFGGIDASLAEILKRLDRRGDQFAEILRRLPEAS